MKLSTLYVLLLLCTLMITTGALTQTSGASGVQLADVKLGTGVQDRELVGEAISFAPGGKVFLWLRVTGAAADSVTVAWTHENITHTTVLSIGGSPWRTWATKTVSRAGKWAVMVSDSKGTVLKELSFIVE